MEIIILPTEEAVAKRSADLVEAQIRTFPDTILGLATGSSPLGLYNELVVRHQEHGLSFSQVRTFNLDEYVGIHQDHPQSYRTFMNVHLFDKIDIEESNTHVPDGTMENPMQAGPAFEQKIKEATKEVAADTGYDEDLGSAPTAPSPQRESDSDGGGGGGTSYSFDGPTSEEAAAGAGSYGGYSSQATGDTTSGRVGFADGGLAAKPKPKAKKMKRGGLASKK